MLLAKRREVEGRGQAGGLDGPASREPARVARDVRNGLVSPAAARETYAVAVSEDGVVDAEETARLRAGRAA